MKKYILRVDERNINALTVTLENEVFPVIETIVQELNNIGITSDYKQMVNEVLAGNFATITGLYKAQLEEDATKFNTASAKENILNQLEPTIKGFKEEIKEIIKNIKGDKVGEVCISDPEVLSFFEIDEAGNPALTEETRKVIKERFTTYVKTDLAADFHKKHLALVEATNQMLDFCRENHVRTNIPASTAFYELEIESGKLQPVNVDYEKILADCKPVEEVEEERGPLVSKPNESNTFKDIARIKKDNGMRVNPDKY